MTLWIEQRGLCWICGEPMHRFVPHGDLLGVSRDHLLPRSRGGRNNVRNYLLAHRKCNSGRGAPKLIGDRQSIQDLKKEALARLRMSPHWVEDYRDHGTYRGAKPPSEQQCLSTTNS